MPCSQASKQQGTSTEGKGGRSGRPQQRLNCCIHVPVHSASMTPASERQLVRQTSGAVQASSGAHTKDADEQRVRSAFGRSTWSHPGSKQQGICTSGAGAAAPQHALWRVIQDATQRVSKSKGPSPKQPSKHASGKTVQSVEAEHSTCPATQRCAAQGSRQQGISVVLVVWSGQQRR